MGGWGVGTTSAGIRGPRAEEADGDHRPGSHSSLLGLDPVLNFTFFSCSGLNLFQLDMGSWRGAMCQQEFLQGQAQGHTDLHVSTCFGRNTTEVT